MRWRGPFFAHHPVRPAMTRPFSVDDILHHERITGMAACAAQRVVYCVESIDAHADAYRSSLWMAGNEDEPPWQLTSGTALDSAPQWAPDARTIAFLSDRDGGPPQIYTIRPHGGEARRLTNLPNGVQTFAWAPDGRSLLAIALAHVDPPDTTHGKRCAEGVQVITEVPYKLDGVGFTLDKRTHLFTVDAGSGAHRQLTQGRYEVRHATWSADGESLYYTRTREGRMAHRTDIWTLRRDGTDARQLTHEVAIVQDPVPSPDGRRIAFAGSECGGDSQTRLWCLDLGTGRVSGLGSADIEVVSSKSLHWSAASDAVETITARNGLQEVARIDVASGRTETVLSGLRHISAMSRAGDRLYFVAESIGEPEQLHVWDAGSGEERQLTALNAWWYERSLPEVRYEPFVVNTDAGGEETVWAWVIRSAQPHTPGPLLIDFHGGPASYVLLSFASHPYWNILWSHGWTIVAVNAVGSSSFGRAFSDRLRGRWGELDLPQHLAVADALHASGVHNGMLAAAGKSYGGYLAAWAACTTDRFRAAIVSAPVADLRSHFGTSDSGPYADPYALDGSPWDAPQTYNRLSPVACAPNTVTPMLLLQGMDDERCPRGQAEQLFTALTATDAAPAELVLYPRGGHHFFEDGRPSYRIDAAARTVDWLTKWLALEPPHR
ncbi:peptidase S9 family protein [Ralstonia pickettii]|nr:peptidase S9 family protein [Ralstonia pickettii]